jgi:hypothetical protein
VIGRVGFDDGANVTAGAQSAIGSVQLGALGLGPRRGEWAEITFTLERDASDATIGPCLRWWHLRALPAPDATQEFRIPLRLHDREQTPFGPARIFDVLTEIEFLASLVHTQQVITYQEGKASYLVHLATLEHGGGNTGKWNATAHRMEGICMVVARTVE